MPALSAALWIIRLSLFGFKGTLSEFLGRGIGFQRNRFLEQFINSLAKTISQILYLEV